MVLVELSLTLRFHVGAASIAANCNDGFSTYWTAEGVGVVGWRLYASLDVYDLCDHGGITGVVGVYAANIRAKGGSYRLPPVAYSRSNSSTWSTAFLGLTYSYSGSGWDMFSVNTNNNIGMSKSTYFDAIKVPMYLVFGGVPGASRHETCTRGSGWSCAGHLGL